MTASGWEPTAVRRRLSRRHAIQAGSALGGLGLLAACGGARPQRGNAGSSAGGSSSAVKRGGTLTALLGTAPPSEQMETQGARSNSGMAQPLFALMYDGLIRLKVGEPYSFTDSTLDGALASSWETPDEQTFVFHLRPGAKFHDKPPVNGRALTSADVKFTFDRFSGSPFAYLNFYTSIGNVETPDGQTVTFKMKAPDAAFLRHLSITWLHT